MDERDHAPRTVHVVLPVTGRPLCGYEEQGPRAGVAVVACPECVVLLRSGLAGHRSRIRGTR